MQISNGFGNTDTGTTALTQIDRDLIKHIELLYSGLPDDRSAMVSFWVWYLDTGKNIVYHRTIAELASFQESLSDSRDRAHIFCSPGLRRDGLTENQRGGKEDVVGLVGFWADIDIAGDAHAEANLPASLTEATDLLHEAYPDCPPTLIVYSGNGIHPYWLFHKPLIFSDDEDRKKAQAYSQQFQRQLLNTAKKKGWKLDNVANIDRAMRMAGTLNHKDPSNPIPTRLIPQDNRPFYELEDLMAAVPEEIKNAASGNAAGKGSGKAQGRSDAGNATEPPQSDFAKILKLCMFCQNAVNNAASLPEPEWHLWMTIIARCMNGEEMAHEFSAPYPGYSYEETQAKYEHALAGPGPATCETIADKTAGRYCDNCQYRWKVTSPIVLGRPQSSGGKTNREKVDELNERFAVSRVGSKVVILSECEDYYTGERTTQYLNKRDFELLLANKKAAQFKDGDFSEVPLAKHWLEHPDRREYEGIVFDPSQKADPSRYYNLFRGFNVQPRKGSWKKFRKHLLNVICGGDKEMLHYVLAWFARILQDPGGERPGVAIVIRGKEGTGKGTVIYYFGRIFGQHYLHITDQNQLTGRFNTSLQDKILVFCDEGFFAGDKSAEGKLKGLITEDTNTIEPKGKDAFVVENHVNLVIASNNDWVVPAGLEARRFLVLEASDEHMQDVKYFAEIHEEMQNGGLEAMMHDLLHMDISEVNLRNVPRTQALFDQIQRTMTPVEKYWFERLQDGTLPEYHPYEGVRDVDAYECNEWRDFVEKDVLHKHFLHFSRDIHGRFPPPKSVFGKDIAKLCPDVRSTKASGNGRGKRVQAYRFPSLDECRAAFEAVVSMKIDWESDVETDLT